MSQEITVQIRRLVAAFPQPPTSADTVAVYVDALSDMNPDVLRSAVDVVIRSDDWFPRIKRLRTACEDFQLAQLSAADDGKYIKRLLSRGQMSKPVEFPNPIMADAVRLMGWGNIVGSEEKYFDRDWVKAWDEAKGLVLKRTAAGEVGDALGMGGTQALKAGS